jgi:hypothetical protein
MKNFTRRGMTVTAAVAVLVGGGAVALASVPGPDGTITGATTLRTRAACG